MGDQLAFPGLGPSPQQTDSLFFAIRPNSETVKRITDLTEQLRYKHGLREKPVAPGRLHVSLFHLGNYHGLPPGIVAMAQEAAASITMSPFNVTFECVGSFAGRTDSRPLVLYNEDGIDQLVDFHRALGRALTRTGLGRWVKPQFTPHITMLYDKIYVTTHPAGPVGWTAQEFVLVHSLLGRSEYKEVGRWSLLG